MSDTDNAILPRLKGTLYLVNSIFAQFCILFYAGREKCLPTFDVTIGNTVKTKLLSCGVAILLATSAGAATINFDDFDHGTLFENGQFNFNGLTGTIVIDNPRGPDLAQIFDTSVKFPTEDPDLQNPTNATTGEVYTGGNAMIISENGDSTNPDDEARGGSISLIFGQLVEFTGITLIDTETRFGNEADVQVDGDVFAVKDAAVGNNQYQVYDGFSYTTNTIKVSFGGSGAFDALEVTPVAPVPIPGFCCLVVGWSGRSRGAAPSQQGCKTGVTSAMPRVRGQGR